MYVMWCCIERDELFMYNCVLQETENKAEEGKDSKEGTDDKAKKDGAKEKVGWVLKVAF